MRHFRIISSSLILLLNSSLFAQVETTIASINIYVKNIDSLIKADEDDQDYIVRTIAEGTINEVRISTTGHKTKADTISKIVGGHGTYTYEDTKGNYLYKITYHDNLKKNFYLRFYYQDNKLIYAELEYQEDDRIGQTFYKRQEYYKTGERLLVNETNAPIKEEYRLRTNINLRQEGDKYLKDFLDKKNVR